MAWEWLRRDREYQRDNQVLLSSNRSGAMAGQFRGKRRLSFCN
ncbi:transcriptional regulator domain-containing protein [Bradyrhizobium pachyrhizi]